MIATNLLLTAILAVNVLNLLANLTTTMSVDSIDKWVFKTYLKVAYR